METEIIKLYDNEDYEYPLIKIRKGHFKDFEKVLNDYRTDNDGTYNLEDFLDLIKTEKWFVEEVHANHEIFF